MNKLEEAITRQNLIESLSKNLKVFVHEEKEWLPIKNAILLVHNTLECLINLLISRYFLGKSAEEEARDKVNHFWFDVLVETNFRKRLQIIQKNELLNVATIIILEKMNDLRNDVAHYPHRSFKRKKNHLMYNKKHIYYDIEAFKEFCDDFAKIIKSVKSRIR